MGAKIFKITNVPKSRYQKSDITIGFSDIELVRKSGWMSQKSAFFGFRNRLIKSVIIYWYIVMGR